MRAEHAYMLLLVDLLHLGKFREAAQHGFSHATLHAPDSYMHPCKCDRDAHEQQHEAARPHRSEEHTSELQSLRHLVCRLLLEKKKNTQCNGTAKHFVQHVHHTSWSLCSS